MGMLNMPIDVSKVKWDAEPAIDVSAVQWDQPEPASEGMPQQRRFDFQSSTPEERKAYSRQQLETGPKWVGQIPLVAASLAGPGLASLGLRTLALRAPSAAGFLTPAATAIETGGLAKTGLTSKAADIGARVAGGATAGAIGTVPLSQDTGEILTGAGIGAVLPGVGIPLVAGYRAIKNALSPTARARNILAQAAGGNINEVRAAAAAAPEELTAAQAIAGVETPQLQAIGKQIAKRDAARRIMPKIKAQQLKNESVLDRLAGGATEAESIARTKQMAGGLREQTVPMLEESLTRANQVSNELLRLEKIAPELSKEAAAEVANVRRFINAGKVAEAASKLEAIRKGMPYWESSYTYRANLGRRAGDAASQAAAKSLELGQEASQAAGTAATMRAAGVEPLTAKNLTDKIKSVMTIDQTANSTLQAGVNRVIDDINKAASVNGAVDARAIYAIRKNSIGAFIKEMFPGAMDSAQKAEAARIMAELNPIIDDAIIKAGGKGFNNYLKTYSEGQRVIERTEMSAFLRDLYKKDPKAFAEVVKGNNTKAVADIFGPTKFDISSEMGESLMRQLRPIADDVARTERMGDLASEGADYAGEIIQRNQPSFRVPRMLPKSTAANAVLETMQSRLPSKTLDELEKAFASGKSLDEIFKIVPPKDRPILKKILLQIPRSPAVVNSLAGENRNSLSQQ
jgi:negative regulator of replication initiation